MIALSSGKAAATLVLTATICGVGFLVRRYRRGSHSRVSSVGIEDPLILQLLPSELSTEDICRHVQTRGRVELHCHLNGTVRKETLRFLLNEEDQVVHTIEDAFRVFGKVYKAINTEEALRRIVKECLTDAQSDNVRYLELRTTPRKLSDVGTRREYVRIVIDEINRFPTLNRSRPLKSFVKDTIAVRLILTIDRSQPVAVADQTVDIALRFSEIIVGIDFAGNPNIGTFSDFLPVFQRAKGHGLFITIHTSEIRGVEAETDTILAFKPNRIGHFLFPTEVQMNTLIASGIQIETCPTSNICALSGKSPTELKIDGHPVLEQLVRHPNNIVSINTDDPGVFNVSLSEEIVAVAKTFALNPAEIDRIISAAAYHAFLTPVEREALAVDILK